LARSFQVIRGVKVTAIACSVVCGPTVDQPDLPAMDASREFDPTIVYRMSVQM
jgi:hypothetical protein